MPAANLLFFTLCQTAQLASAAALARSVSRHHPEARCVVWVVDADACPDTPGLTLRPAREAFAREDWERLALTYEPERLAEALVPHCAARLFAEGESIIVWAGCETQLQAPLSAVLERIDAGAQGVLLPRSRTPLAPAAEFGIDDLTLLREGAYGRLVALRAGAGTDALLAWWWDSVRGAVPQVPGARPVAPLHWLHFATIFQPGIEPLAADLSGAFMDFGSFNPNPPPAAAVREREAFLRAMEAAPLCSAPPRFAEGPGVDPIARFAWQRARREGERFSTQLGTGQGSFHEWLLSPAPGEGRGDGAITQYLLAAYRMRPDIQTRFPDPFGIDRTRFLTWARLRLPTELGADAAMLEAQLPRAPLAVNFAGYLRAKLGIAEAARGYAQALAAQGVRIHYTDFSDTTLSPLGENDLPLDEDNCSLAAPHPINIIHVNADMLFEFERKVGRGWFEGRYNIGIWAWETPRFPPEWWDRFALLDEIWVGSAFMAEAIGKVAPIPVVHVPHVVECPEVEPDRARFGLPADELLLLFFFDFHSTTTRKNPHAVVEAFRRAFRPDAPVRLVLKSINGRSRPDALHALKQAAEGARITVIDEALDGRTRYQLIASCDAFVSLHRAEGFGLGMAEAMALGKPVIATGWSGNMDFMNADNSYPVAYTLEPLAEADPPYVAGTLWAVPDVDDAARMMRRIAERREEARAVGERARRDIAAGNGRTAVGELMCARLRRIEEHVALHGLAAHLPGAGPRPVQRRMALLRILRRAWRTLLPHVPTRHQARLFNFARRIKRHFPVVR